MEQAILQKSHVFAVQIHKELIRKTIHMLIALVPSLATLIGNASTLIVLGTGILFLHIHRSCSTTWSYHSYYYTPNVSCFQNSRKSTALYLVLLRWVLVLCLHYCCIPAPLLSLPFIRLLLETALQVLWENCLVKPISRLPGGKTLEGFLACLITAGMCCIPFTQKPFHYFVTGLYRGVF